MEFLYFEIFVIIKSSVDVEGSGDKLENIEIEIARKISFEGLIPCKSRSKSLAGRALILNYYSVIVLMSGDSYIGVATLQHPQKI